MAFQFIPHILVYGEVEISGKAAAMPREFKAFGLIKNEGPDQEYLQVNLDSFAIISDWYPFAIVDWACVSGIRPDAKLSQSIDLFTALQRAPGFWKIHR